METENEEAPPFKYCLLGQHGSGIDHIAQRFAFGDLRYGARSWTGIEFFTTTIVVDDIEHSVDIWSARASEHRFYNFSPVFLRGSFGILLVFDVSETSSFYKVAEALEYVRKHMDDNIVITLVANKIDLPNRSVSTEEGQKYATENGLLYAETSALTGEGIADLGIMVTREVSQRCKDGKLTHTAAGFKLRPQTPGLLDGNRWVMCASSGCSI